MYPPNTHEELTSKEQNINNKADRVEIIFFTDPLCCWSWALEPQWRRLQFEYAAQIWCRYVMTGLLPSWKNYNDPIYSVSRPQQMGPVWLQAAEASGMPINSKIWVTDSPASSYPACIAIKTLELQSPSAAKKYLRMLREAVMLHEKNIAKQEVLLQVAEDLQSTHPGLFDLNSFARDLSNDAGIEAFRPDWQEAQNRNITRTPTLIMRSAGAAAVILTGYRPYKILLEALKQVAPLIQPHKTSISLNAYQQYWGNMTAREIQEVL